MLPTYKEWRQKVKEMAGVATIVSKADCYNPDFQVQGAFCGEPKTTPATPKKKGRRKKAKKG